VTDQGYGQGQPYGQQQGQGAGYPGQGYPAPTPGGGAAAGKGFVSSLFDVSFTNFVTPTIIKVVYVLVMILAGLGALGIAFTGFSVNAIFGIITLVIIAPLAFFVELALWRISLEIFMVIFRIGEDIRAIRNGGGLR
jgi:Domain of unknown function (DUF4282)